MSSPQRAEHLLLVIENEPSAREATTLLLQLEGFQVAAAADGREGLDYLAKGLHPDLILLDMIMPGMDGWAFLRELKQDPVLAQIPVVIVTAIGGANAAWAASIGATGWVRKPVDISELMNTIRRVCDARSP